MLLIHRAWFEVDSFLSCLHAVSHQRVGYRHAMAENLVGKPNRFQNSAEETLTAAAGARGFT